MTWQGFPAALCLFRFKIIADDGDGVEDDWGWFLVMMMTMVEMMVVIDLAGVLATLPI